MTSPVEWSQVIGPATGAAIALVGVLSGLLVTGRRAERESQIRREDELRTEQRRAIAAVLASAKTYQRLGEALSEPAAWVDSGYERATALADGTDQAMAEFQQNIVIARLLVGEAPLVSDLDEALAANHAVAEVIHEVVNSFWGQRPPGDVVLQRDGRWHEFEEALTQLQADAITVLRPTIREVKKSRLAVARALLRPNSEEPGRPQ